ncbi:MAG TPA: class I SAM-dependent methyltransferase [Ktedonobacterales bacterium]|nr:class I SAM-dependent methyltransferase [Ktedonobacterales bacterium]
MNTFDVMRQRYRAHDTPWDQPLPPPEIIALAEELPAGKALDLGCGPGRSCLYLAQRGWRCDGVDFVPEAVELAQQRAAQAGLADRVRFTVGSVTHLEGMDPPYDLAIDIGCMHNLRGDDLTAYAAEVARVVRGGGLYALFAHLAAVGGAAEEQHGQPDQTIRTLFAPTFTLERVELGQTTIGDQTWPSAWYWFRRRAEDR